MYSQTQAHLHTLTDINALSPLNILSDTSTSHTIVDSHKCILLCMDAWSRSKKENCPSIIQDLINFVVDLLIGVNVTRINCRDHQKWSMFNLIQWNIFYYKFYAAIILYWHHHSAL